MAGARTARMVPVTHRPVRASSTATPDLENLRIGLNGDGGLAPSPLSLRSIPWHAPARHLGHTHGYRRLKSRAESSGWCRPGSPGPSCPCTSSQPTPAGGGCLIRVLPIAGASHKPDLGRAYAYGSVTAGIGVVPPELLSPVSVAGTRTHVPTTRLTERFLLVQVSARMTGCVSIELMFSGESTCSMARIPAPMTPAWEPIWEGTTVRFRVARGVDPV